MGVPGAWAAFESGDSGYLRRVSDAARAVAADVDVVLLAQASMMSATLMLSDLSTPVLASPVLAVQDALARARR